MEADSGEYSNDYLFNVLFGDIVLLFMTLAYSVFFLVFLMDIQHSHYVDNAIFLDLNTPFSSETHKNKEKIGTVTKDIMMRAKRKKTTIFV